MQSIRKEYLAAFVLLVAAAFVGYARGAPQEQDPKVAAKPRPTIVFMTDFGTANDAVAICKAVMLSIARVR